MFYQSKSNRNYAVNLSQVTAMEIEQRAECWALVAVFPDGKRSIIETAPEERTVREAFKYLLDRLDYKTYVSIEGGNVDAYY